MELCCTVLSSIIDAVQYSTGQYVASVIEVFLHTVRNAVKAVEFAAFSRSKMTTKTQIMTMIMRHPDFSEQKKRRAN